ncbi:MAG: hypothetical protein VB877_19770 [Pirellulaceae bacterium]
MPPATITETPEETGGSLTLPFIHLNLRFNPFGELPLKYRAELAIIDTAPLLAHLDRPGAVLQLLGDKGRGKTTHLLTIKSGFPDAAYVHFPEGERPPIPAGSPLLLDEAQRIPWWQRRQLFQFSGPLVLGTHRDFTRQLQRLGRDVKTIEAGEGTNAARLDQVFHRRIEFARRDPGPVPSIPMNTIHHLLAQHGDDLRAMEGRLYERFQELEKPCHVQM